ncbi:MAG TPA: hypothetical protein VNJ04_06905 [Gemmatimonadaceae bacterium]|nr:hypothetical protein [Gemmatimonadaceae bacterium]
MLKIPEDDPAIGVIVVNWKRAADTVACLDSLANSQRGPERIVVVDNASGDDSVARIREWATARKVSFALFRETDLADSITSGEKSGDATRSYLTVIVSATNKGFSGGNNLGLRLFGHDQHLTHFLLLNNDATVREDFFTELKRGLGSAPDAGILTGTIYNYPATDTVWYAGGHVVPFRGLIVHDFDVPDDGNVRPTGFVSGCVMLISRPLFAAIGALPECYFPGYSEDAEYCSRATRSGFSLLYAPRAVAFHKVGATAGAASASPYITQVQVRHRVLYVRRNFRGTDRVVALGYLAATKTARALVETIKGKPQMGRAFLKGALEGFFSSPRPD